MKTPFWPTTLQFIFKAIHLPLYTYLLWWFQKYNKHCTKSNILYIQKVDAFTTLLVCSKSSTLHNSRWTFFSHIFFTTRYPLYLVYTMTIKIVSQSALLLFTFYFTYQHSTTTTSTELFVIIICIYFKCKQTIGENIV